MIALLDEEIKSKFRNDYHKALVNLYYSNNVIGEQFFKMMRKYGLAALQFNVLRILKGQYPQTASIGLIIECMPDKNSDVSRIVINCIKRNLLTRKKVKLTAGRRIF